MNINLLVSKHDFSFLAWNDGLGCGVWAVCTPITGHADTISYLSDTKDFYMVERNNFLLSIEWLPVVVADSLVEAMAALETKLAKLPAGQLERHSLWSKAIFRAMELLDEGENRFKSIPLAFTDFKPELK